MSSFPKYDWFQTDSAVTLMILKRNVELSTCRAAYSATERRLTVYVGEDVIFDEALTQDVDHDDFTLKCTPAKIEIRMPKKAHMRWDKFIEQKAEPSQKVQLEKKKNWDKLEKEMEKEEEDEQLEGDAAVSKLFRKIYAGASDDVKKAMMKSYTESNGTVLSTNWEEISRQKTEIKPPDSMEFKKYEQ